MSEDMFNKLHSELEYGLWSSTVSCFQNKSASVNAPVWQMLVIMGPVLLPGQWVTSLCDWTPKMVSLVTVATETNANGLCSDRC